MKICRGLCRDIPGRTTAVTIGTYDGVHIGHRAILKKLRKIANENNELATVVTFNPHPQLVVNNKKKNEIKLLNTEEEKISLLESLGIDILVILQFDRDMAMMSAQEFVTSIIFNKLNAKHVVIGYDHNFGKNREGGLKTITALADEFGGHVEFMGPVSREEIVISSTKIRHLLLDGKIQTANKLLGRNYQISGIVTTGDGRGKKLGFPTANIQPLSPLKLIPQNGIYAVRVLIDGQAYQGISYIGCRPTFYSGNIGHQIEVNIYDFSTDLYSKNIILEFISKIRDDKKFDSPEDLAKQILKDKEKSIVIFENFERSN